MNLIDAALLAAIMLPAAGFTVWAWLAMAEVEEEMRAFAGFEGMHLEPDAAPPADAGGASCRTPG